MQTERKPIILDDKKFSLLGKFNPEAKGTPKLSFGVYNGNVSITVFPNDPSDQERKPIKAKMDAMAFGAFIQACNTIVNGEPGKEIQMQNRAGAPGKTFVDSTTIIGKDDNGVIYLGVIKEGRAKKKFSVLPVQYHSFIYKTGEKLSEGETSRLFAIGYFDLLSRFVSHYILDTYVPPQPMGNQPNRGGNNPGYNNRPNGNTQTKPQRSSGGGSFDDFDDDLPM